MKMLVGFSILVMLLVVPVYVSASPISYSVPSIDDENGYLTLSTNSVIVMTGRTETVEITLINIDTQTRDFDISLTTTDAGLSFYFNSQNLTRNVVAPDNYEFSLTSFTSVVPNQTIVLTFGISSRLPSGLVYKLSSFDLHLSSTDGELESHALQILSTMSYTMLDTYPMNNTGQLCNSVCYRMTENPVMASTPSLLTIKVNNTDTISHDYVVNILDRVGSLRVFRGTEELVGASYESGVIYTIDIGTVYDYFSLPLYLSVSQVKGASWSRHMIEISASVDSTDYKPKMFGLDVGNSAWAGFEVEKLLRHKINSDTIKVTMTFSESLMGNLFALIVPGSDAVSLLQWTSDKVATAVFKNVVFPALFETAPAGGFSLGVVAIIGTIGIGLIIKGLFVLPENQGLGMTIILVGAALVCGVLIVCCVKRERIW